MSLVRGKRIIDLSRVIAGPYATMVLADFGCEVIKIEPPQGDPTRQWGPPWYEKESAYFMSINRNKRSLALNLKEPKCRDVLYKLVARSDAVIQNFVPGVAEKLKVDYQTLKAHNANLVYCSVSGFGDVGSKRSYPAFDNLIQAETGFMHLTGAVDGQPFKLGFAIVDVLTSLYAANGLLAGMIYQMQSGEGIHVKTSLYESAVAALINQGSNYLNGGVEPRRMGNNHPNLVPYGLYKTSTLPIIICVGTPGQYQSLLRVLGLESRAQFASNELRVRNRREFDLFLNQALCRLSLEEASSLFERNGIPCGRVNDLRGLFESQTVRELGLVEEVNGKRFVRSPIRTDKGEGVKIKEPPGLNEHGREILEEMGLSGAEVEEILFLSRK